MSFKGGGVREYNGDSPSTRIWTFRNDTEVPFVVDLGGGYVANFSPIIEHDYFRRLNEINQLSLMNRVYRGATHKRWEHSVGVFYICQEIAKSRYVRLDAYGRFELLCIGLLHDVGHGPDSHVSEITAVDYGLPDHKEIGLRKIEEMRPVIEEVAKKAGFSGDTINRVVEDLKNQIKLKGPIYRLVAPKDRADKWDYVARDSHHCNAGSVPDVVGLVDNFYFDGERSAIHVKGMGALRGLIEAYTNNNTDFYKNKGLEAIEALKSRATVYAMERGFDLEQGFNLDDADFNVELGKFPESRRILDAIKANNGSRLVSVGALKLKGKEWLARQNGIDVHVDEVTEEEMEEIGSKIKIPKLVVIERGFMNELGLNPEDFVITSSPQIKRMEIDKSYVVSFDAGEPVFRDIFDETPGLAQYMRSRLKEHWSVEFVASRNKVEKVAEKIKERGGPKKVLMEALEKAD